MSYGVKYRIEYKRRSEGLTTIDILEKSYAGSVTNLVPDGIPFEISYQGDLNNIYVPTIGTGATIRVLATPLTLIGFFTSDPQKYMVKAYHGATGVNLFWQGFISPEIFSENYSYSSSILVPIEIQCNDGMQVLDYINYDINIGGSPTGNENIAGHIGAILGALATTYTTIYTSTDISVAIASETNLFTYLKTANENYMDEKGITMSCRQVLDSILVGLGGLVMRFKGDGVYIYDPICLHDTDNGKSYVRADFGSETVISTLGGYLDISNGDIQWYQTDSPLDYIPVKNEVIVKYDPYNFNDYTYDFSNVDNHLTVGSWVHQAGGFFEDFDITYKDWAATYDYQTIGLLEAANTDPVYCLSFRNTSGIAILVVPGSNVGTDDQASLKISISGFAHTKSTDDNIFSGAASISINAYYLEYSIRVGDNMYWKDDNHWEADATGNYKSIMTFIQDGISVGEFNANPTASQVNDTWTIGTDTVYLTGGGIIAEEITLTFYDSWGVGDVVTPGTYADMKRLFLKDCRVEVIGSATRKNVGSEGIEKRGRITTNLTGKSAFTVNSTTGTGPYSCSRGALRGVTSGVFIEGLYRGGTLYNTGDLLVQSLQSQYKDPRMKLSGVLDTTGLDIDFNLIKDTDYLGTKAFYIVSLNYNDRDECASVEMIEVIGTREAIT